MAGLGRGRTACGVLVAGLVLSGCGSTEPEPLQPARPAVPADLCAAVPEDVRDGLVTSSSAAGTGEPTAACSLRSEPGGPSDLRAVVTWTQLNDEDSATGVMESQCRSIDTQQYAVQDDLQVEGGDDTCAGDGRSANSSTIAVRSNREVLVVRVDSGSSAQPDALTRGTAIAEGVLASLRGE